MAALEAEEKAKGGRATEDGMEASASETLRHKTTAREARTATETSRRDVAYTDGFHPQDALLNSPSPKLLNSTVQLNACFSAPRTLVLFYKKSR
ncbi:hypothetical protein NDU88_006684 [Pleurodeles waltl]|uniref:Uncharacterized protein n=1 Tax=Pleurodeles waltl TaxID=8319 RepID=A0AAV7UM70_PLEWA|nr:hypothetical protein NDU88_006684 [Pleurodeles waltl]